MTDLTRSEVEQHLADLACGLILAAAPDLRAAVRSRLVDSQPQSRTFGAALRWRVAAAALTAVALVGATSPGRAAVARFWQFAGVVFRESAPSPVPGPTGTPGPIGVPGEVATDLAGARRLVNFAVLATPILGIPDSVLVGDQGRVVSLIYRAGAGRPPADAAGISVRLDEFDGSEGAVFLKSISGPAVEPVDVLGSPGVWVPEPHDVTYLDRGGGYRSAPPHLSGSTLVWQVGTVTLRLEGAFSRDRALAVARSVRR